jgi:RND family efflux transporter MFP subunit
MAIHIDLQERSGAGSPSNFNQMKIGMFHHNGLHHLAKRVIFTLLMTCLVLLSACSGQTTQAEPTPTPIPTPVIPTKPTYKVARGDVEQLLKFTGRIVPVDEQGLFFGVGGRVDEVLVQQGDAVKAGQLLAVLESGNREFDLKRSQIFLEMAQLSLQSTILQLPKNTKAYTETITLKEKEVELAQLNLDELNKAVADSRIISPIDGVIRSLNLRDGAVAEPFEPVIVVADLSNLEVSGDVGGDSMTKLAEGMEVTITPVVLEGDALTGKIYSLPYPYGSGSKDALDQSLRIAVDQDLVAGGYEVGDLVEVVVLLEKSEDILWLPPQAIRTFEGRKFVVVKDGDGQRRVDVRTGLQSDDRVEILEGVEEGQVILAP